MIHDDRVLRRKVTFIYALLAGVSRARSAARDSRWFYAVTLYGGNDATLDDLREAVTTLEDAERTARRVLGGAHPTTVGIECDLQPARAALRAREETPSSET